MIYFLVRNLVKPREMPRPLALTGITAHTQKHFTSSYKTPKKESAWERNIHIAVESYTAV